MAPQFTALQNLNVHCDENMGLACSSCLASSNYRRCRSIGLENPIILTVSFPIWMSGAEAGTGQFLQVRKAILVRIWIPSSSYRELVWVVFELFLICSVI